ncbi:uracil-DNA glycosylase family protein [Saccharospirillum mangrovi]|uniref:uracil-DNA glycosylase family protein n=1 Tax=Saccharospirillum mangrovi TaxID=2161747 RepID=UPI000D3B252B|nr:uracil-DNA glycosylase family protein [Saccharospirillum mangrovi]
MTDALIDRVRACRLCADHLPESPRPILQFDRRARLLIAGQAPGIRAHQAGVPFQDASGNRLRDWLGLDNDTFYDPAQIAIIPMGFCYPGHAASGDAPPRPECAPAWRNALLAQLSQLQLTLIIGRHALDWHWPEAADLTSAVRAGLNEKRQALPHPSPRNNGWLKRHPWFETDTLPSLRAAVAQALGGQRR